MPQVKIVARNFMDMVASLPAMKLDKLYENSFICVAILRSLPPLAKQYVVRLLDIDGPVSSKFLEEWVLPCGISEHRVAVERLIQLRFLTETVDGKKEATYVVNRSFQHNLRKLVHGGVLPREPMPSNITVRLPSLDELDAYAVQQWELFLLRVINSSEAEKSTNISSSMLKTFQRGLLRQKDDKEPAKLTESGFQFLLLDANAQLWYIVREYITNCEEHGVDTADLISFLLELSFHVTGKAYNLNTLSDRQRSIVNDLGDLGLVKLQQGRKESWFIPTKYATNLSISLADTSLRKEGYVVVETNFRIYAYSTSKLHCEILRLFSRIEYQLPNLIVGSITNESLKEAFENGIAAEQIVSFLQQNARPPRVAERLPSVPENVTDMIRLWEAEMNRVDIGHAGAGVFDELPSQDVFEAACNFARENGGLLWGNSKEMRIVVKGEIYEEMEKILVGDSKGNSNRKRSRKVEKILDEFSRVNSNSKRARKSFLCLS